MERENFDTSRSSFRQVDDKTRIKSIKQVRIQSVFFIFALVMKIVCNSLTEEVKRTNAYKEYKAIKLNYKNQIDNCEELNN